ncbi:MAG: ribosome biogenesis GTP-binding protein YihA/YsxC [Eubacterium sp.]|jgi:GTP-binding protein|nr:ribosome biogenesis GTP-binding protein YihA/YsxC [Eubacterium sp.]
MNWNKAEFFISYKKRSQIPISEKPEIAFSGRSNVGKSSLINNILNRKSLARVSGTPGKTAMINFFEVDGRIYFVDLPGYGYAKVSKAEKENWAKLVEGYLTSGRELDLVFQLVDFRHSPTVGDLQMIDFLINTEIPFVIVLTKADKLKKTRRIKRREELLIEIPFAKDITMVEFSSVTGEGAEELRKIVEMIIAKQ